MDEVNQLYYKLNLKNKNRTKISRFRIFQYYLDLDLKKEIIKKADKYFNFLENEYNLT